VGAQVRDERIFGTLVKRDDHPRTHRGVLERLLKQVRANYRAVNLAQRATAGESGRSSEAEECWKGNWDRSERGCSETVAG
jgi:hypothetical protein